MAKFPVNPFTTAHEIVGLHFNTNNRGLVVNDIRCLFPKDLTGWLNWIKNGKALYLNKEKVQNLIAQQRTNLADVNNLDLNSINNIIQNFENPSVSEKNPEHYSGKIKFSKPGDMAQHFADILSQSDDLNISQMVLTEKATNQMEALKSLERLSGRDITNRETGIKAQINSTQRNKLVSGATLAKSQNNGFSFEDHFAAVANIDKLFENGTMVDDRPDKSGDPNVVSIKRFVAPVLLGDDFAEAYITVKETTGSKIYSMELDELKKPSDLKGGTLKERYHIPEGYNKLLQKIEKARATLKNPENSVLRRFVTELRRKNRKIEIRN